MDIAIVEDETKLATLLEDYLRQENFTTRTYSNGTLALEAILQSPPDCVLLDLMLPGTDGMTVCRELRKSLSVPIIMTTARVEEIDRLLGLEIGADDYVCKPYSPREVVARVKAVTRRYAPVANTPDSGNPQHSYQEGFQLLEDSAQVVINSRECPLTAVELKLLKTLYENPGRIFNRTQLMNRIYPDNRIVSDRTIDSHVKKLRQKLQSLDTQREFIHSVYGIGYKFEWHTLS